MLKFITKSNLQVLWREGKKVLELSPQTRITEEAREFAQFVGIEIKYQTIKRVKYVLGNWKMAPQLKDAISWIKDFNFSVSLPRDFKIGIAPPASHLFLFFPHLKENRNFYLGAQNFYPASGGAYTGEMSIDFYRDLGVSFLIIGHSERRHLLKETDDFIREKLIYAFHNFPGIIVYCIGETLLEKKSAQTFSVLKRQLQPLRELELISERIVIAYEPVWSIGTGLVGDNYELNKILSFIRKEINAISKEVGAGDKVSILYGGSVKGSNIEKLVQLSEADGFLIGGASLKAKEFSSIIDFYKEVK